jgi:carboxypeptidase family protein
MSRLHTALVLILALVTLGACHPGPVIGSGGQPNVGGTIAGIVTTDGNTPVAGRKVTVIETTTGARFDATTGVDGGYTIKVPRGTYRIEVQLQGTERVVKQPDPTKIDKSDLDPHRNIVITAR